MLWVRVTSSTRPKPPTPMVATRRSESSRMLSTPRPSLSSSVVVVSVMRSTALRSNTHHAQPCSRRRIFECLADASDNHSRVGVCGNRSFVPDSPVFMTSFLFPSHSYSRLKLKSHFIFFSHRAIANSLPFPFGNPTETSGYLWRIFS